MRRGFYMNVYGMDCFMESESKNRTKALALDFVNKIQNKLNRFTNVSDADIEYIRKGMQPATMEVKTIKNGEYAGLRYISIDGDGFSFGTDAYDDPFEYAVIV